MANEIQIHSASGKNVYVVLRNAAAKPWNTGSLAFESYASGNYNAYGIALVEQAGSGFYVGSLPAGIPSGGYTLDVRQRTGSSVFATSDTPITVLTLATGSAALPGGVQIGHVTTS